MCRFKFVQMILEPKRSLLCGKNVVDLKFEMGMIKEEIFYLSWWFWVYLMKIIPEMCRVH